MKITNAQTQSCIGLKSSIWCYHHDTKYFSNYLRLKKAYLGGLYG